MTETSERQTSNGAQNFHVKCNISVAAAAAAVLGPVHVRALVQGAAATLVTMTRYARATTTKCPLIAFLPTVRQCKERRITIGALINYLYYSGGSLIVIVV